MTKLTFGPINLNYVLMNRVMKVGLLPRNPYCASGDFFESNFGGRRDVQAKFFYQQIIGSLTDLPRTVQKPVKEVSSSRTGSTGEHAELTSTEPRGCWLPEREP